MNFDASSLSSMLSEYGLWLALALLLLIAGVLAYKHVKSDKRVLKQILKKHAKAVVYDAVLFDGVDSYQFADYLLLLQGKIVVVKWDDSEGYIFGASNIHEWTWVENHVTGKFRNPLGKLEHFATQIKQEFGFEAVEAWVLFGSNATFPKGVPDNVLRISTLDEDMEKLLGDESKDEAAKAAWDKLKPMLARDKSEVDIPK